MLGAQGIRATGFKRAQGNVHCAKFESHTNRVTFETNAIRMTSSVQAHCSITMVDIGILKQPKVYSCPYYQKFSKIFYSRIRYGTRTAGAAKRRNRVVRVKEVFCGEDLKIV